MPFLPQKFRFASWRLSVCLLLLLSVSQGIGQKPETPTKGSANTQAATLECPSLSTEEIRSVQKTPLKTVNTSQFPQAGYRVTHCLYQTEDINRGVSLSITEADPDDPQKYSIKTLWEKMFAERSEDKEEREKLEEKSDRPPHGDAEEEDEEKPTKTKRIKGFGKDAYWVTNESGGALFILVEQRIVRISVGGRDDLRKKLQSSKTLARAALPRI